MEFFLFLPFQKHLTMIFYFSGCGNSKHVAETIAAGLNDTLTFIPKAAREGRYGYTLAEGERLGFVFPVYSWAPPKLVLDFIGKMRLAAKPAYLYFACTMGDECGLTEKVFRKAIEAKGWALSACFSLQMPETYIGMPGFKLDTDENAKRKIEAADKAMKEYIPKLQNKESFSKMTVGHCGKCVNVCPLQNITLENGKPTWHGNCTICMACYHHCPVNAIQYGKATKGKGQYFF